MAQVTDFATPSNISIQIGCEIIGLSLSLLILGSPYDSDDFPHKDGLFLGNSKIHRYLIVYHTKSH
jgi:hypothetical protein